MKPREVICPYCERNAELVGGDVIYPARPDLFAKKFWLCAPCGAYVGCHAQGSGTRPLGRLADAELRAAKQEVHRAFDPLWHDSRPHRNRLRKRAYEWLAGRLEIEPKQCHIGMFDVETCKRAVIICTEQGAQFRPASGDCDL